VCLFGIIICVVLLLYTEFPPSFVVLLAHAVISLYTVRCTLRFDLVWVCVALVVATVFFSSVAFLVVVFNQKFTQSPHRASVANKLLPLLSVLLYLQPAK